MDRRELLQMGAATIAAASFVKTAFAQNAAPAAPGAAPAAAAAPPPVKSGLTVYSRNLQWCRTPQDVAKAIIEIGLEKADLTIGAAPSHVDPAAVRTDLPAFVNGLKQGGVSTVAVTTPIVDADTPNAEAIIATAAGQGITHYVWGGLTYDVTKPYQPQLDALKSRVQRLYRLNERNKIKGIYRPAAGAGNVGSGFYDILDVLSNFDPRYIGIHYDTAALLGATTQSFVLHMRAGAPYIGGMALNDAAVTLDLPNYEYGPFIPNGPNGAVNALNGPAGDNVGNANGNPLAIGGGGRPLPYNINPTRVGMGMIDLTLIGKTLKEMNFTGPIETHVYYPLGGVEKGADKITLPRQAVVGFLKRDRLTVEHGFFAGGWNIDIGRPAFLVNGGRPVPNAGRGGAAAAPAAGGAPAPGRGAGGGGEAF